MSLMSLKSLTMKPILDIQNLTKSFGSLVLFHNISFSIGEGQRVGLIAKNGTGKSTLLSVLTGKEGYDSGSIIYRNGLRVAMLEQTPAFDPEECARRLLQSTEQREPSCSQEWPRRDGV